MEWMIKNYVVENMLAVSGDDMAHFEILANTKENESLNARIVLTFDDFVHFLKTTEPAIGRYLARIRSSIMGYGPKHSKVFEILEDEQFDFEKYLLQYLSTKSPEYFEERQVPQQKQISEEEQKMLEQKMQMLDDVMAGMPQSTITYTEFLDKVDEALHQLTFKYYPSLFEKGDKHIAAYKDRLIRTTMDYAREIDQLMHDKFNQYWEEKWNEGKA